MRSHTSARPLDRVLLPIVALIALASVAAPSSLAAQRGPGTRAMLPGMDGPILLDTMALAVPIAGNRDSIFAALTTVFNELKIPVQLNDPKHSLMNNLNADVSRRLGGQPMSRYIDCGRGFSGNNADIYRITLAVTAWIDPTEGDPQRLMVAIAASGRDPSGSHSAYTVCTSRGALEKRIGERVQQLAGKS